MFILSPRRKSGGLHDGDVYLFVARETRADHCMDHGCHRCLLPREKNSPTSEIYARGGGLLMTPIYFRFRHSTESELLPLPLRSSRHLNYMKTVCCTRRKIIFSVLYTMVYTRTWHEHFTSFNEDTCVRVSFFAYRVFSPGRVSSTAWKLGKTCLWNDWHYCPLARWPFRMQRQLSWDIEWYEVGAMTVDGWAVTFGTAAQWGDWRGHSLSRPLLAVPNVTTHLLTAV